MERAELGEWRKRSALGARVVWGVAGERVEILCSGPEVGRCSASSETERLVCVGCKGCGACEKGGGDESGGGLASLQIPRPP